MDLDITLSVSPSTVNRGDDAEVLLEAENTGGSDVLIERVVLSGGWDHLNGDPTLVGLPVVVPSGGTVTFKRAFKAHTQYVPANGPRPPGDPEGCSLSAIVVTDEGLAYLPANASYTVLF